MEVLGLFITLILGVVVPVVFIGGVVYLIVYIVKHQSQGVDWGYLFRGALKLYTYAMLTITLFIFSVSLAIGIKAVFASLTEYGFSYAYEYYYSDMKPTSLNETQEVVRYNGSDYIADKGKIKADMVYGGLASVVTLFLAGIHFGLKKYLESDKLSNDALNKTYLIFNLVIYSITALGSILVSIKTLADYLLLDENVYDYNAAHPGMSIGMTLIFTPIWLVYLFISVKLFSQHKESNSLSKE